jgi:hypothetical protein
MVHYPKGTMILVSPELGPGEKMEMGQILASQNLLSRLKAKEIDRILSGGVRLHLERLGRRRLKCVRGGVVLLRLDGMLRQEDRVCRRPSQKLVNWKRGTRGHSQRYWGEV